MPGENGHVQLLFAIFGRRQLDLDEPVLPSITEEGMTITLKQAVDEALKTLPPCKGNKDSVPWNKGELVLQLRFGLKTEQPQTLEATGRRPEFLLSKERIRQLEAWALRRLRHPDRSRRLRQFLPHRGIV